MGFPREHAQRDVAVILNARHVAGFSIASTHVGTGPKRARIELADHGEFRVVSSVKGTRKGLGHIVSALGHHTL